MSEDPHRTGPAPAPEGAPSAAPSSSGVRTFVGLFVVALLVVIMCVGVFVLFGWAAYERRSVADYLSDLRDNRSFFAHRRKQAAYELSKILSAQPDALRDDPSAGVELRRLFASALGVGRRVPALDAVDRRVRRVRIADREQDRRARLHGRIGACSH